MSWRPLSQLRRYWFSDVERRPLGRSPCSWETFVPSHFFVYLFSVFAAFLLAGASPWISFRVVGRPAILKRRFSEGLADRKPRINNKDNNWRLRCASSSHNIWPLLRWCESVSSTGRHVPMSPLSSCCPLFPSRCFPWQGPGTGTCRAYGREFAVEIPPAGVSRRRCQGKSL